MENNYSLESITEFVNQEEEHLKDVGLKSDVEGPSEQTIQNILSYSKQLSVRKSQTLGRYVQNCN